MKVLQINNVYDFGSTGKIAKDIHMGLQEQGIDSVVYYGRRYKTKDKSVYKICGELYAKANNGFSRISGLMYGGCVLSTARLIAAIKREKPDIVHLQCLNGYFVNIYRLIEFLKKSGIPTVLTLHAEFMHTANCGHAYDCEKWKTGCGNCPRLKIATGALWFDRTAESWKRMKAAFDGFEKLTIVSVSPWLMERAKQSPIFADKHHCVVFNGIDTGIFHPYDTADIKAELGIAQDDRVVFHATPYFSNDSNHIKGGYYVKALAQRFISEAVRFVVAGEYDHSINYPSNMIMLGQIRDQVQLAKLYSMADVTLLTSKKETFSMICAESFCCGTPVVGFKAGAPEMISLARFSCFVEYGDISQIEIAIKQMPLCNEDEIAESAYCRYSRKYMLDMYRHIYLTMLD